jgi:ribonuclease J
MIIKMEQARKLPDNQVVILTTGSQGEEASALARIARQEHKTIEIKKGDTCVVSASPDSRKRTLHFFSALKSCPAWVLKVLYQKILDIHTSGHAYQEDLKLDDFSDQTKEFHADSRRTPHVGGARGSGTGCGCAGCKISSRSTTASSWNCRAAAPKSQKPKSPPVTSFVDGLGVGDVGEVVLRDRQVMSKDGMFVIIMTIDKRTGKLNSPPDIISRGFIYMKGSEDLLKEVKHEVRKVVETKSKIPPLGIYPLRTKLGEFIRSEVRDNPSANSCSNEQNAAQ